MKEYVNMFTCNYLDNDKHEYLTKSILDTSYDESSENYELKLSITCEVKGQSITNYIYLDIDFVDELMYALVKFKQDVNSVKFDRSSK